MRFRRAEAAIIRVADVCAALLERRPYKPEATPATVIHTMRAWRGKLDARAFLALERLVACEAPAVIPSVTP